MKCARQAAGATTFDPGDPLGNNITLRTRQPFSLARNGLSPQAGSSQYVIDHEAIKRLPLGDSTPINQVLLQAPGEVVLGRAGKLHTQLAVLNGLDRSYQLRDGSCIGVGAPQYGPRRGLYLSVQKDL